MRENKKMINTSVSPGDIFIKKDRVGSFYVVDKVMDFSPAPPHVRLIEQGGNERLTTVALSALLDTRVWLPKKDK